MVVTFPLFDKPGHTARHPDRLSQGDEELEYTESQAPEENAIPKVEDEPVKQEQEEARRGGEFVDSAAGELKNDSLDPQRVKTWKCSFSIASITNTSLQSQQFFYTIKLLRSGKLAACGSIPAKTFYSSGYALNPRESVDFPKPMKIWSNEILTMAYAELPEYELCLDMWQIHLFTFNHIYSRYKISLQDILNNNYYTTWILKSEDVEVQRIGVYFSLERVFSFSLILHDWSFIPVNEMPKALCNVPKSLQIVMRYSNGLRGKGIASSEGNFWPGPVRFPFTGTLNEVRSSFLELTLLAKTSGKWYRPPSQMGKCHISLRTVPESSYLSSTIKRLTYERPKFLQGSISGYLELVLLEEGPKNMEAKWTQVDLSNVPRYSSSSALSLQVTVVRAEGLGDVVDMGEVRVRAAWDGMVSVTRSAQVCEGTAYYNESLVFPVMLVDNREVVNPTMIRHILPIDLHTRGNISFEVSTCEAELLGSAFLQLRKLDPRTLDPQALGPDGCATFRLPIESVEGYSMALVIRAGFSPPLPPEFEFIHEPEVEFRRNMFNSSAKRWEKEFGAFQRVYKSWFPMAPQQRDFWPLDYSTGLPLSCMLTRIRLPAHQFLPLRLLHWVASYPLEAPGPGSRGAGPGSLVLSRRRVRGAADRALLLAGVLMAQRQDVYVAKGTLRARPHTPAENSRHAGHADDSKLSGSGAGRAERAPHYWVVTRQGNDVSFWDPLLVSCSRDGLITLRNRYVRHATPPQFMVPTAASAGDTGTAETAEAAMAKVLLLDKMRAAREFNFNPRDFTLPDAFIPLVVSGPTEPAERAGATGPAHGSPSLARVIRDNVMRLPFAPNAERAVDAEAAKLPYESVEIMFNCYQVWGNLQNHNPALISYDFENAEHWRPFLSAPVQPLVTEMQVGPPAERSHVEHLQDELFYHMQHLIFCCARRGSRHEVRRVQLDLLADLLEDALMEGFLHAAPSSFGGRPDIKKRPDIQEAETDCSDDTDCEGDCSFSARCALNSTSDSALNWWLERREEFLRAFGKTEPGRTRFVLPMHLKQAGLAELSQLFFNSKGLGELLRVLPLGTNFSVAVKAFPLLAGVFSTWVILLINLPSACTATTK